MLWTNANAFCFSKASIDNFLKGVDAWKDKSLIVDEKLQFSNLTTNKA